LLHQYAQDAQHVRTDAQAIIGLTKMHGPVTWLAASGVLLGWAIAALGDPAKGFSISQSGLSDYRATGNTVRDAYYCALHADVCLMDGRLDEGAEHAKEALAVSARTGDVHWDAELHRLAGELCCRRSDSAAGFEHLQRAVKIARTQGARILELRARVSMWRHADLESDRKLARGELERLYSGFDEGHQSKDLMAARQVLN
jgi:predicted ATPase